MNVLSRRVTLRINVLCLLLVLLLICAAVLAYWYFAPGNLFFMLLREEAVESVQRNWGGELQTLTREEAAEVVNILKDFRITEKGLRGRPPENYALAELQIHMKTGMTVYVDYRIGVVINEMHYSDHNDVADRLVAFFRQGK